MDDVIADATGQFIDYYEKEFGVRVERAILDGKDEGEGFPDNHTILRQFPFRKGFFRTMRPNENCQEVLRDLNARYELFIVSAAMEFPQSLSEKLEWLNEHLPFLSWHQFVFCGSKRIVHGDYMIDDLPHNLEHFKGERLIYTAPHNTRVNGFDRVNNWREIRDRFL